MRVRNLENSVCFPRRYIDIRCRLLWRNVNQFKRFKEFVRLINTVDNILHEILHAVATINPHHDFLMARIGRNTVNDPSELLDPLNLTRLFVYDSLFILNLVTIIE
ncbi:MAG: hypothetical protein DIU71_19310 [Proteobacteria bacterium]|nr:MAG: hypothetical protein DIU71_19310 [Pseudomonadota bacterium]